MQKLKSVISDKKLDRKRPGKLSKTEITLLEIFGHHDHTYSFYVCPAHGLHAHLKTIEYNGCPTCKTVCHALTSENLATLKKQIK